MIERLRRIGPKKRSMNAEAKMRPIIVKFVSYRDRQVVFNSKKLLKESGFKITESLKKEANVIAYSVCFAILRALLISHSPFPVVFVEGRRLLLQKLKRRPGVHVWAHDSSESTARP